MEVRVITQQDKEAFNAITHHPLQSYEWGDFREKTGVKVIRRGFFENNRLVTGVQLTIHPIPHTPWTIGYLPKGSLPDEQILQELHKIGKEEKCIFIQLEPNVEKTQNSKLKIQNLIDNCQLSIVNSCHPLFTKYTFVLDLTKSEQDLIAAMHAKTRYNIKVAQKHEVLVTEDNSEAAFAKYWQLTEATTMRQKFYAHTKNYHEIQWKNFHHTDNTKTLTSHLFVGKYQTKILTTLMLFVYHDTLYYPYGASSNENRNVMHSTLTMWEAIRFGKKMGLKRFDMWGALGENPDTQDPWFGFHRFKQGFGPQLVEFIGSYDLVINPLVYKLFAASDKLRWLYLKTKKRA